jgi:hypothetical protein
MERPDRAVVAGMNSAPDWSGGEDGTVGPRGLCRGDLLLNCPELSSTVQYACFNGFPAGRTT